MNRKVAYVILSVVVFGGLYVLSGRGRQPADVNYNHEHIQINSATKQAAPSGGTADEAGPKSPQDLALQKAQLKAKTQAEVKGEAAADVHEKAGLRKVPDAIKDVSAANMAKGQKVVDSIARDAVAKSSQKTSAAPTMKCLMAFMSRGASNAFKGKLQIKLKVKQDAANKDRLVQEVDQIVAQPSDQKQPNQTLKELDEEAYLCFFKALDAKLIEKPPKADEYFEKHDKMDVESAFDVQIRGKK